MLHFNAAGAFGFTKKIFNWGLKMDKPFLTFDQQIKKLKNDYELIINDENFAKEALASLSYYDLINGYKFMYMDSNNKYKEGISIEKLYTTHIFNKNIQGVLLKYSTYVENSFKTLLSHVVARHFSEHQDDYLRIENYVRHRDIKQRLRLEKLLKHMFNTCKHCDDTPTKHYIKTKNHIPPWILFRNVSFSNTTNLFSFLKNREKEVLFNNLHLFNNNLLTYQDKVNISLDSLNLVRKFRNMIAHNLNFLTYRKSNLNKKANKLFINTLASNFELNKTRTDVWAMVISIVIWLNNKYLVQNFLAEFQSFMKLNDELASIYCEVAGIPLDYEKRINNYLNNLPLEDSQNIRSSSKKIIIDEVAATKKD